jgi:DNA-directed RNA polymerase subunit RPC12/RpoP
MSIEAMKLALEGLKKWSLDKDPRGADDYITALQTAIEQAEKQSEFIKHTVANTYDWSEWVCPDPESYLMKCCDCGLVHEAEFKVVRYKSETEREDCEPVDDPSVQAVFRMRRSEQWSPEDTAYRPGGLAQECNNCGGTGDVSGEYPGAACPECSGKGVIKPVIKPAEQAQPVAQIHCSEKRKPGGCQLHNLHCGWPKCNEPQKQEQAQPVAEPERWAAYMDGDERVTCYDTEAEACGERECDIDGDYEPGTEVEYLVAPMINAKELLRRERAWRIGEQIHEQIENDLAEDFADADEEVLSLNKEDYADLGKLVIDFMCERGKTAWWTVDSKREQKRIYIAGSNDEAAHGIKGEA